MGQRRGYEHDIIDPVRINQVVERFDATNHRIWQDAAGRRRGLHEADDLHPGTAANDLLRKHLRFRRRANDERSALQLASRPEGIDDAAHDEPLEPDTANHHQPGNEEPATGDSEDARIPEETEADHRDDAHCAG